MKAFYKLHSLLSAARLKHVRPKVKPDHVTCPAIKQTYEFTALLHYGDMIPIGIAGA